MNRSSYWIKHRCAVFRNADRTEYVNQGYLSVRSAIKDQIFWIGVVTYTKNSGLTLTYRGSKPFKTIVENFASCDFVSGTMYSWRPHSCCRERKIWTVFTILPRKFRRLCGIFPRYVNLQVWCFISATTYVVKMLSLWNWFMIHY